MFFQLFLCGIFGLNVQESAHLCCLQMTNLLIFPWFFSLWNEPANNFLILERKKYEYEVEILSPIWF